MLGHVSELTIQVNYLVQLYKIKPANSRAVYDLLKEKTFQFKGVETSRSSLPG